MDSCTIAPDEVREIVNRSNDVCNMLVVIPYPPGSEAMTDGLTNPLVAVRRQGQGRDHHRRFRRLRRGRRARRWPPPAPSSC